MKIKILIPYPALKNTVVQAIRHTKIPPQVTIEPVVVAVEELADIDVTDADVVIARGYTAQQIRRQIPSLIIVELEITGYDVMRALSSLQILPPPRKVGFCGGYSMMEGCKILNKWLSYPLEVYYDEAFSHIPDMVKRAAQNHCDVILGGYSAVRYAQKIGLRRLLVESGTEAVERALVEAIRSLQIKRDEKIKAEMYRLITKNAAEGILFVDRNGRIGVDNQSARILAGQKGTPLCKRLLEDVFPLLVPGVHKALLDEDEQVHDIIRLNTEHTVSVTFTPVISNATRYGVVLNLVDISRIQKIEGDIRTRLSERGLQTRYTFENIIYGSKTMEKAINDAKRFALSDANIIILGATGTGKEVFAQSIHHYSQRKDGPFVAVNCAALPEGLLESELFGYVGGAFTGSRKEGKMGLVEQAHRGTLFLDEISEIPISLQGKLLRVLQEREVRRIGAEKVVRVDIRIIAATNKNLNEQVKKGMFRQDLLFRIDVLRLYLPPLAERNGDTELIFHYLLNQFSQQNGYPPSNLELSAEARKLLMTYPFEGNIRELRNIVERICVLHTGSVISGEEMRDVLYRGDLSITRNATPVENHESIDESIQFSRSQAEYQKLMEVKEICHGHRGKMAALLKIDRSTLWRKMKKFGIK